MNDAQANKQQLFKIVSALTKFIEKADAQAITKKDLPKSSPIDRAEGAPTTGVKKEGGLLVPDWF